MSEWPEDRNRRRFRWNARDDNQNARGEGWADARAPRFVVHLPVVTTDLASALNLACVLARALSFMPEVDGRETTVAEENAPQVRHRVFCDRRLPDGAGCTGRSGHPGRCAPYYRKAG